jgi:hypothetical protein
MKKKTLYILGGIAVLATVLYIKKVKVESTQSGSLTDKWVKKHPLSEDSSTGNKLVPLLVVLLNYGKTTLAK